MIAKTWDGNKVEAVKLFSSERMVIGDYLCQRWFVRDIKDCKADEEIRWVQLEKCSKLQAINVY